MTNVLQLSSDFFACRTTKVGNYDITQLRPTRFIGQPKVRYVASTTLCHYFAPFSSLAVCVSILTSQGRGLRSVPGQHQQSHADTIGNL